MTDALPAIRDGVRDGFGYAEAGPPDGRALVFLHGIGGGARAFDPQLVHFGDRWRALAWDMPGYGRSTRAAEATIAGLAGRLAEFLAGLGVASPVLVGHSLGGMVVQEYLAGAHAPRPRAVVLAGTSPAFGRADGDWQRQFIAARVAPLDAGRTMPELAEEMVDALLGEAPDPGGRFAAIASMAAVPAATYRVAVASLLGFDRRKALAAIDVPCLLIAGTRDPNAPADMMRTMASKIPGAFCAEMAGVGHLMNLERPALFNGVLAEFLAGLAA